MTATAVAGPPDFLVVGTPRSGTTLVQRLASELPGVRVTPETHFFAGFYERVLRHDRFPLPADLLRTRLREYLSMRAVAGIPLVAEEVLAAVGPRCESPWQLFGVVVRLLAGDARLIGEKTPDHLRWWQPLSVASPSLKFVAVLRDPRAVVASGKEAPFGMDTAPLLAARWREDLHELELACTTLPIDRFLMLRYEDVVARPEEARLALGSFLGVHGPAIPIENQGDVDLFYPGESGWKAQALGPVDPARAGSWRTRLSMREQMQVESVLRQDMERLGYHLTAPATRRAGTLSLADRVRVVRHSRAREAQRRRIALTVLVEGEMNVG